MDKDGAKLGLMALEKAEVAGELRTALRNLVAAAEPVPTGLSAAVIILNNAFPSGHNEAPLNECFVAELSELGRTLAAAVTAAQKVLK